MKERVAKGAGLAMAVRGEPCLLPNGSKPSQHKNGRDWDEETYDVKAKAEGRFGRSWSLSRTQRKEGSPYRNTMELRHKG